MRIISKYTDYYDCIQYHGADDEDMWLRKKEEHWNLPEFGDKLDYPYSERTCDFAIIGFCGKLYPVVRTSIPSSYFFRENKASYIANHRYFYDQESLEVYYKNLKDCDEKKDLDGYVEKAVKRKFYKWSYSHKTVKDHFEYSGKDFSEFFIKYNIPIFTVRRSYLGRSTHGLLITFNDELDMYGFQQIMDPYTAYQELSMYIGGVLRRPENPVIDISDEDMAACKGFNEWSFRTTPGTKKPRRKGKNG